MVGLATRASNEYINSTYFGGKGNISSVGYNKGGEKDGEGEQKLHRCCRKNFVKLTDIEGGMTRNDSNFFSISRHTQKDDMVLAVICKCAPLARRKTG